MDTGPHGRPADRDGNDPEPRAPLVFTATAVAGDPSGVAVMPGTVNLNALGATSQLSATLVDANGNTVAGGTFTWGTSDAAVVTVEATGLVNCRGQR